MKHLLIKTGCTLLALGLSFSASAEVGSHVGRKDVWEQINEMKVSLKESVAVIQHNQAAFLKMEEACISLASSRPCNKQELISSINTKMELILKDWEKVELTINDLERSQNSGANAYVDSRVGAYQEGEFVRCLADITRLNKRASDTNNLALNDFKEFQIANAQLFASSAG